MGFILEFFSVLGISILYVSPIFIILLVFITFLGLIVGRIEGWQKKEAVYFAFITANTVGYGAVHPEKSGSRFLSIVIAFTGILLTGLIVALAVNAVDYAFKNTHNFDQIRAEVRGDVEGEH